MSNIDRHASAIGFQHDSPTEIGEALSGFTMKGAADPVVEEVGQPDDSKTPFMQDLEVVEASLKRVCPRLVISRSVSLCSKPARCPLGEAGEMWSC